MTMADSLIRFLLLLHKHLLVMWHRKVRSLLELILPATLVFFLLGPIRFYDHPYAFSSVNYTELLPLDINKLDFNKWKGEGPYYAALPKIDQIVYTPTYPVCIDRIIEFAAKHLNIKYYNWTYWTHQDTTPDSYVVVEFDKATDCENIISYKLRFNYNSVFQDFSEPNMTWMTNQLYINLLPFNPRNAFQSDGDVPVGYYREGFAQIQHAIAKAFFDIHAPKKDGKTIPYYPKVSLRRMPYQLNWADNRIIDFNKLLPLLVIIGYLHPMLFIVRQVANERVKQLKEFLAISGFPNWLHWTAWYVRTFVILGISVYFLVRVLTDDLFREKPILISSSFEAVYLFFMVYIVASVTFCLMLANMFSKAFTATVATAVLWFLTYVPFMPFSILARHYASMSVFAKLPWMLLPNTALNFGINIISGLEIQRVGLRKSTMFDPVNANDQISMGILLIAMLLSSCIYMLMSLYLEQKYVRDSYVRKFGAAKKSWNCNFLCDRAFWLRKLAVRRPWRRKKRINLGSIERESPESFESEPVGRPIGIQIRNLKKSFDDQIVVDGLSMNMYEDQITVLSVQNDAGKTATISMITGIIPPTAGTIIINGYDIKTHLRRARMSLGICSRNDILFDGLTVKDHLIFYSRLRGLIGRPLRVEVEKYLRKTGLEKQAKDVPSKLSFSAKRMLCLGIAFCGGTKVVLCDETSSGLNPADKQMQWKFLKTERKGRTILFTTNFMYEAEVLGDRIAIMSDGELKCMGTPFFLINKFGYGFKLTVIKAGQCFNIDQITRVIIKYIPDVTLKSDFGIDVSYYLPSKYASQFPAMLQELENRSNTLAIKGFDISTTSLDEVFVRVCSKNLQNDAVPTIKRIGGSDRIDSPTSSNMFLDNSQLLWGPKLIFNQWLAMFWKKIISVRRIKIWPIQILLPICLTVLTFAMQLNKLPSLEMDLNRYHNTVTVLGVTKVDKKSLEYKIGEFYKEFFTSLSPNHILVDIEKKDLQEYMLDLERTQQREVNNKYIVAATIDKGLITAWFNNEPLHSVPLAINLVHNAMAKALFNRTDVGIVVGNKPREYTPINRLYFDSYYDNDKAHFALNYAFCMSIITALYAINLIKETQSRAKLFQFISGIDVLTYWVSHFIVDITTFALTGLVTIIILGCFQEQGCKTWQDLGRISGIILLFGCAALPMTYFVAKFFTEPTSAIIFLSICNIIYGPFMYYIIQFIKRAKGYVLPEEYKINLTRTINSTEEILFFYPHYALPHALKNVMFFEEPELYCPLVIEALRCKSFEEVCCRIVKSYLSMESPGILREIYALVITGGVFSFVLLLTDYICIPRHFQNIRRILRNKHIKRYCEDESVETEKFEVAKLSTTDMKRQHQNLVIKNLTKIYGNRVKVNKISIAIKHYECFGVLGGKGAGKTALIKMLTGDEHISSGDAFVKGLSVQWRRNAVNKLTGYCPQQFDGFLDYLTGCEHLYLHALLRGIPRDKITPLSMQLGTFVDLMKDYYKPVREYNAINKRKLSIALALLGGPRVIYLDDPTTGMDLATRRDIWNIIRQLCDAGCSVLLTSRSMAECEAICNRSSFMDNGRLKTIGSTQKIKNLITKGYILKIKMRSIEVIASNSEGESGIQVDGDNDNGNDKDVMAARTQKVLSFVRSKFPSAILKETNEEFLIFYIPFEKKWWSKIFDLEANKDSLNIEDYSISHMPYEANIF